MKKRLLTTIFIIIFIFSSFSTAFGSEKDVSFAVVDITQMNIAQLQQAVDEGKLTYKQIMTLYMDRIEAYGEMYHCMISLSETALQEAENCDKIYKSQGRTSPVFGLPVIVKDNIDVAGMATTNGNKTLSNNIAKKDADVVASLKNAGAIIVAKANMDRYAEHSQYSISDFGRVNNAFDLNRTSYGSSGGSAVSAAAALAPICVGTDTNASIRVPSSANGVVGMRPTKGLLSAGGITTLLADRDTAGPIAKTVTDAALILSAMNNFEIDYTEFLSADSLDGMRIGVVTRLTYGSEEVNRYFDNALSAMRKAGATIVSMSFSFPSNWTCDVAAYRKVFTAAMDRYAVDVAVYPTIRSTVMTHQVASTSKGNSNGWYIGPAAGVPAMTVPMALDKNGLSVGIEFVGRSYDEKTVFAAGYALEQTLGLNIQTSLAPCLYQIPQEVTDLFEFKKQPIFGQIGGYEKDYDKVESAYKAAVSYLETEYYSDAEAGNKAKKLMNSYNDAVTEYEASYKSWKNRMVIFAVIGIAVLIGLVALFINRRKKKSAEKESLETAV